MSMKISLLALAGKALAAATGVSTADLVPLQLPYYPPAATCYEYRVPITVTSDVLTFDFPAWADDLALQNFLTAATTRASAGYPSVVTGTTNITGSYTIAASFCTPTDKALRKGTVILATHGIGQARSHWNAAYEPERYNFVQHAIAQGYSVWFYDRLGTGESTKISGFVNQLRLQKNLLVALARLVKNGQYTADFVPDKLAVMGFSFGSYVTHFAVAEHPDLADAAVLTGINYNTSAINANGLVRSFVPRVASLQNNVRFGTLDPGYLTWADSIVQINTYFKYPYYDLPTTSYAETQKEAFAIGEFLTITDGEFDAGNFTGAALAITGETDYIICDGDCRGVFEEPARTIWRNAKSFVPYLHPLASHNINFHHNATGAYTVITDFLEANGL